ncbi:MAG: hypothetical protein OEW17_07760 [Gemmatimonadota bacterium]|nr:hypothetical protein [Gemmatimonadota bacterium]
MPAIRTYLHHSGQHLIPLALAFGAFNSSTNAAAQLCWRGHPVPECRSSLVTEAGPRFETGQPHGPLGYTVALGVMRNKGVGQNSLGVVVEVSTAPEGGTYVVTPMPRLRRWLSESVALEAGAGLSLLGPGDPPVGFKGATGFVALNYRDLVLVTTGLNYVADGISAGTSLSLGLRFGSYLGPPVLLATLVGAAAAAGGGS